MLEEMGGESTPDGVNPGNTSVPAGIGAEVSTGEPRVVMPPAVPPAVVSDDSAVSPDLAAA